MIASEALNYLYTEFVVRFGLHAEDQTYARETIEALRSLSKALNCPNPHIEAHKRAGLDYLEQFGRNSKVIKT